ncbi:Two-component response regulator ARR22, partial [Mucuna pruriens]
MEGQDKKHKGKGVLQYENSGAHLKVLIVDGDRFTRQLHEELLQGVGVTDYFCVENGQQAVELHWEGESFDLILMDYNMPIMNGIEATRELRSMGICCKIIGVSYLSRKAAKEFVEAGLDDYYKKPFTDDMLSKILNKITGKDKGKGVVIYEKCGAQLKVLVVDDDRHIRNHYEVLLTRIGVTDFVSVKHGQEAVDLCRNGETFDLILMGKDMPIMNGTLTTKVLRSMGIRSIIIGWSYESRENVQEFVDAGLDDYYKYPFCCEILHEILSQVKPLKPSSTAFF